MSRFIGRIIPLLTLALFVPGIVRADILEQIPANAKVVVIVKDIPTLEKNVREFAEKLELPIPPEAIEFNSALEIIGVPAKLGKQAAFVVTEPSPTGMTVIIELADPKAAKKLEGLEKTDDEDVFLANLMGVPALLAFEDEFVFVQFTVEDDEGFDAFDDIEKSLADVLSPSQKNVLKKSDVYFSVNVREWREIAVQGLDTAEEAMKAGLEQAGGEEALNAVPGMSMKGYFEWIFKSARSIVEQTESIYGGIHVSADHAELLVSTKFEEGSYLAGIVPKTETKTSEFFADLPVMPYLMAGGSEVKSVAKPMRDFVDGFYGSMFANLDKETLETLKKSMAYADLTDQMNMIVGVGGPNGLQGVGLLFSSDPAKLLKEYKSTLASSGKIMKAFYGKEIEIKPIEKVVDEHKVTEVVTDIGQFLGPQNDAAAAAGVDPTQIIKALYGGTKMIAQLEQLEEGVGYAMSTKENPITLLDSDELLQDDPSVKETIALLPAKSVGAGVIDPFQFFRMIGAVISATMPDAKMPEPDDADASLPPIGIAVDTEANTTTTHVVVSTKTIKSLIAYVIKLSQMPGPAPQFPADPDEPEEKNKI